MALEYIPPDVHRFPSLRGICRAENGVAGLNDTAPESHGPIYTVYWTRR